MRFSILAALIVVMVAFGGYKIGYQQAYLNAYREPEFGVIVRKGLTFPEPKVDSVISMIEKYGTHTRFVRGNTTCERLARSFERMVDFIDYAADPLRSSDRMIDGDDVRDKVFKSAYFITENCSDELARGMSDLRMAFEEAQKITYLSLYRYRE